MKRTLNLMLVFAVAGALLTISSCHHKKDDVTPPTDVQIDKLSKTTKWKVSSVTLDAQPVTGYETFTLSFSGTHGQTNINYTTANRPALSPWDASGTFTFNATNPQTNMTRNDAGAAVEFSYSVSDNTLLLQFNYNGDGFVASKTEVVKGQWAFNMVPN